MNSPWTPEQLMLLAPPQVEDAPPPGQLLTIGYTEPEAQQRLEAFLSQPDAMVIDIRYSPRSRWRPAFNKSALLQRYGPRQYQHCPALGNVNYHQSGAPITLADPFTGARQVLPLLYSGRSLMLLCACKAYERCHRKTVFDLLEPFLQEAKARHSERSAHV